MIPDEPAEEDHPQTIKNEPDARGSATFKQPPPKPAQSVREEASPLGPGATALGDAELARQDGGRAETIGDAIGSGAGLDIGSGTPPDHGELGGGEAANVSEDVDPLGSYRPGESRD
jgi:hypothetical protein